MPFTVMLVAVIVCAAAVVKVPLDPMVSAAMAVRFTAVVVVPPFICKLLNVVKMVAGKVLVPVKITVPVPGVHVAVPVPMVIAPPRLSVPPAVMVMVPFADATVPPSLKLPAISVEPLVKVIVPLLAAILFPTNTAPETVSVEELENVSVPADAVAPVCPSCTLAHAEAASTVTVKPPSMITTSPAIGCTPAPTADPPLVVDHTVPVEFDQFPVALE